MLTFYPEVTARASDNRPPAPAHGREQGIVFNCPNRLYRGWDRKGWVAGEGVDEIRYEEEAESRFKLD